MNKEKKTYIEGIYNYCDRWCERCRFTSNCFLFTTESRIASHQILNNGEMPKAEDVFPHMEDIDENDADKCAIQFTPLNDSAKVIIAFKSIKDQVEFMNSIYSSEEMKQIGSGMSFEKLANSKVLKTTGGLLGLTVAGYGLYKMFSKKSEDN